MALHNFFPDLRSFLFSFLSVFSCVRIMGIARIFSGGCTNTPTWQPLPSKNFLKKWLLTLLGGALTTYLYPYKLCPKFFSCPEVHIGWLLSAFKCILKSCISYNGCHIMHMLGSTNDVRRFESNMQLSAIIYFLCFSTKKAKSHFRWCILSAH